MKKGMRRTGINLVTFLLLVVLALSFQALQASAKRQIWGIGHQGHEDYDHGQGGPPNGDFEAGNLSGWRTNYNWPGGHGFPPGHTWEIRVSPEYARKGRFGCRIYNANNEGWSGAQLISQDFRDGSAGYRMWLRLAGGCRTYWSGVIIGIVDVASGGEIRYEGNALGNAWHHGNTIDGYFRLIPHVWEKYYFDFVDDFKAKYGRMPGSLRRIYIEVYQDSDSCDIYVDGIKGYGEIGESRENRHFVTVEGLLQNGVEYEFRLNEYVLTPYPGYEREYRKLHRLLEQPVRVSGYAHPGEPVLGGEGILLEVTQVEPIAAPPSPRGKVIVDDPSFARLTVVPNPGGRILWATDYVLEIMAMDPERPVEVSYLVTSGNGTPFNHVSGLENRGNNFTAGCNPSSQCYFHTEIGGWARREFAANPQYLPLPHYRTCVLMLARYDRIYVIFLRENDGELSYKVLHGGPLTSFAVPGLGHLTRQGNRFEIRSYGNPVEVDLWAMGKYFHDEATGWAPQYYAIPHYGMFMLMLSHYDKIGLIIGNENDGQVAAVTLTGSHTWVTEGVPGFCQVSALIPRCPERSRCPGVAPRVEVRALSSDPVEVSHFAFDNTCWQWEVKGWAKREFAPNPQIFDVKRRIPGFIMVSRYGNVGIYFYKERNGHLGVLPVGNSSIFGEGGRKTLPSTTLWWRELRLSD